jgi:predicted membrane-bound spermidine synthase
MRDSKTRTHSIEEGGGMQELIVRLYLTALGAGERLRRSVHGEDGQATAEYVAVILLLVAVFAGLAAFGPRIAGAIADAVEAVINKVTDSIG